jgi:hypothetical protein
MALISESAEEGNYNHDETIADQSMVQKDKYTFDEMVKLLSKDSGKDVEEVAAQFLLVYNIAADADPNLIEKMKKLIEIPLGNLSKAVSKAEEYHSVKCNFKIGEEVNFGRIITTLSASGRIKTAFQI